MIEDIIQKQAMAMNALNDSILRFQESISAAKASLSPEERIKLEEFEKDAENCIRIAKNSGDTKTLTDFITRKYKDGF